MQRPRGLEPPRAGERDIVTSEQITSFISVVKLGSFSKAAKALYLAPQTVMQQIGSLENELGVKLLERSAQGTRPTPAGASYYESAVKIASMMDDAQSRARLTAQGTPLVRLARCDGRISQRHHLMRVATEYARRFPQVAQRQSEESYSPLTDLRSVQDDTVDIVEWIEKPDALLPGTAYTPLVGAVPVLLTSKNHPLAGREGIELRDLEGLKIHCSNPFWFPAVAARLRSEAPTAELVNHPSDEVGIANVCLNGGIFLVWDTVDGAPTDDFARLPLSSDFEASFGLAHAADPRPEIRDFIDVATEMFPFERPRQDG